MAAFAELDDNNIVIRVCNADQVAIDENGGDQSDSAAQQFKSLIPFTFNGVKWMQCSESGAFRGRMPGVGDTYDETEDAFIAPKPFSSWVLDSNFEWVAPVTRPNETDVYRFTRWDEINLRWLASDARDTKQYYWNPDTSSFVEIV
jgi:hypothetical protein